MSTPADRIRRALGFCHRRFWSQKVRDAIKDAASAIAELERERDELRAGLERNPRAWIVTKQGMTGDLYEALAWDNGGKPLGVSVSTPTPLYEGEALRAKLTKLNDLMAVIHRDGGHYQAEHGTAKAIEDAKVGDRSDPPVARAEGGVMDDLIQRLRAEPTASQFLRIGDLVESLVAERKEAADRIAALEAAAPPIPRVEQEPVAWVLFDDIFIAPKDMQDDPPNLECMKPLYASPLAIREPTEDECREIWRAIRRTTATDQITGGRAMFNAVREVMTK